MAEDIRWISFAEAEERYGGGGGGGIGGSIADQQVAFGAGTDISGSDDIKWDDNNKSLAISASNSEGLDPFPAALSITASPSSIGTNSIEVKDVDGILHCSVSVDESSASIKLIGFAGNQNISLRVHANQPALVTITGDIVSIGDTGSVTIHGPEGVVSFSPLASPPSSPEEGWIYAGTDHHFYYYNGTTWKQLDN